MKSSRNSVELPQDGALKDIWEQLQIIQSDLTSTSSGKQKEEETLSKINSALYNINLEFELILLKGGFPDKHPAKLVLEELESNFRKSTLDKEQKNFNNLKIYWMIFTMDNSFKEFNKVVSPIIDEINLEHKLNEAKSHGNDILEKELTDQLRKQAKDILSNIKTNFEKFGYNISNLNKVVNEINTAQTSEQLITLTNKYHQIKTNLDLFIEQQEKNDLKNLEKQLLAAESRGKTMMEEQLIEQLRMQAKNLVESIKVSFEKIGRRIENIDEVERMLNSTQDPEKLIELVNTYNYLNKASKLTQPELPENKAIERKRIREEKINIGGSRSAASSPSGSPSPSPKRAGFFPSNQDSPQEQKTGKPNLNIGHNRKK